MCVGILILKAWDLLFSVSVFLNIMWSTMPKNLSSLEINMSTMCHTRNCLIINPNLFVLEHSWFLNHFGYQNARKKTLLPLSHPTPR